MEQNILEIEHLTTSFRSGQRDIPALHDVSIQVPPGKIIGIVGESGCGKSMTARAIMGLLPYSGRIVSGSICLNGTELTTLKEADQSKLRGKEVSMIFQEPMTSLNPVMKVGKQVQEALLLHQTCSKQEAKHQVLQMFEKVGISDPQKRYHCYPHELSGGLRQRVMIAMAMICKPKLLIADEPTTALDVTVQAQILGLMKTLREETGTSIILISHNLGVVAQLCDYVYVMYAGQIVEQADIFALFDHPSHPYTRGLMQAVRSLERRQNVLDTISGMVPSLDAIPEGCGFAPRCPYCTVQCTAAMPQLRQVTSNHTVRCFAPKED